MTEPPLLPPGMTAPDVQKTALEEGYGDEEPKSENDLFVQECLDWLERWFDANQQLPADTQPFVILFDPSRPTADVLSNANFLPSFRHSLDGAIGGRIYAATVNLKNVYGQQTSLKTVPEVLGFLATSNLGHLHAVAVSPTQHIAHVHYGVDLDETYTVSFGRLSSEAFSFDNLDEYLEYYYRHHLATHECDNDVWFHAGDRKLKGYPERQIQRSLHSFFRHSVLPKSARIDREVQTYKGREDLRILKINGSAFEGAIMELKVLFPDKTEVANLAWAKAGVDQVAGYEQTDVTVKLRYVCCYDGRKEDLAMPEGVSYAEAKEVRWRRYFMQTPGCDKLISAFDS